MTHRLKDLDLRRAKPDPEGRKTLVLPDGHGLRLVVTPAGRKHWQFKTAAGGVERTTQIGSYPAMSLQAARQKAEELREMVRKGCNPVAEIRLEKLRRRTQAATTFESVAGDLLAGKKKNVGAGYWRKIDAAFRANLYPVLGNLPIC